jgi:hypothetical protein
MATKKIQRTHTTAKNIYVIVKREADGYLLNDADGSFAAAPVDPYVSLAEHPVIKGLYEKSEARSVWTDGNYTIVAYERVGGAPNPVVDTVIDDEPQILAILADAEAAAPGTLIAKVQGLVKDTDAKLAEADWNNGIAGALGRYSKHRPKMSVTDIAGDGTNVYAVPVGWVQEFSGIESVEYPIGDNPETLLDKDDDYAIYVTSSAEQIRLIAVAPPATESFRVKFSVPRTEATIAANDMDAVANLAAHICLGMLASRYISTKKPAIQADSVNYQSKSSECTSRGKVCLTFYNDHMGIKDDGSTPAASAVSSATINYPGGMDRLTHPRRGRLLR